MTIQPPLSETEVEQYLARVQFTGSRDVSEASLNALHRAHLLAIPYENLDIHLGRPLTLDPHAIFRKLVMEQRGGWCYEMNGLFGRVLESLGFDVRYMAGAVGRARNGDTVEGNHLVLLVTLDRPWIADVGFGDGFIEPLPLEAGSYTRDFLHYRVARDGERWIVHNHEFGGADSFDFTLEPRAIQDFAAKCHELQTSPASGFVQKTVCQRFLADGLITLRGAIFQRVTALGKTSRTVESARDYAEVLRSHFGLAPPGIEALFPRTWEKHMEWVKAQTGEA